MDSVDDQIETLLEWSRLDGNAKARLEIVARGWLIERARTRRLRDMLDEAQGGPFEMTGADLELELAMARGIAEAHCPHRLPWEEPSA